MEGVSSSTLITIYVDLVSIPNHISSSQTNFKSRFKTDFKVQKSSSKMQKANFKIGFRRVQQFNIALYV